MCQGKVLKIKRVTLDIKAKDVAEYLGLSKTYISLMENGKEKIPSNTYAKWNHFLNTYNK